MYSAVDTIWVLLGTVLVFFMQAGFAMVETGFTRAKNAGNIIMKNLMDVSLGSVVFWFLGFGLMFKGTGALVGGFDFFLLSGDYGGSYPSYAFVMFQTVFCATAATIVSGAMAERTKFSAYCVYSIILSMLVYPISGHWIWGGGFLASMGFHDFAGSTAVHMVGGIAALVGAKILGPRIGKYDADGKSNAIPGHSVTLGALGVFILWFCWFGFNGGSTVGATGDDTLLAMSSIFMTTNIAAAAATVCVMLLTWVKYGKPDVSMTLNGSLAGLVAITAGCDAVSPMSAAIIGVIAGFAVVYGIEFVDKTLKIDDPVGAVGVHGINGALGTLLVGVFATDGGLISGGGFHLLGVQAIGVLSVAAWVVVTMFIVFKIIDATIGLRVSAKEEISGLDMYEHGLASAYGDFVLSGTDEYFAKPETEVSAEPVEVIRTTTTATGDGSKLTKVDVVCNETKGEALKDALAQIGITGMTVSNVMGYGIQGGHKTYYRGSELKTNLLPKVRFEIVISAIPTELVIDTIKKTLYTGNIGDGKIFVYDVEDVVRVSTGERGFDALQEK